MNTMIGKSGREFSCETEMIDASMCHRPNPHWSLTDPSGHLHQWYVDGKPAVAYHPLMRFELPSLELIVDVEATDEYPAITHHECRQCRARVEPGHTADSARVMIPGLRFYSIDGNSVSQEDFVREVKAEFGIDLNGG